MAMSNAGTVSTPRDPYSALRVASYRRFLGGTFVSNLGRQALGAAAMWQIYDWTHSPAALGLIGLVNFAPYVALALPAGQLADRGHRRMLIQTTLSISAVLSLVLAWVVFAPSSVPEWPLWRGINEWIATLSGLFDKTAPHARFDHPALGLVFLLLTVNSIVRTLGMPARASLVPLILPRELLANAITWSSSSFELSMVAGPMLAGLLFDRVGFAGLCAIDAVLGLTMVGLFTGVEFREPPAPTEPRTWRSLGAGIGFIWRHKVIFAANSLDMLATLFGGAVALVPIFAKDILHVGPAGFAGLRIAQSIGAIVMALVLVRLPPMRRPGLSLLWCVVGFGAAIIGFGLSSWFWLSFLFLMISGALDNVSVVVRQSLVQLMTPDHLRGRVTSVNQIFIMSSNELCTLRIGLMVGLFGPITATVAGGLGTILVVAATAMAFPQLKRLGRLHELKPAE